MEQQQQPDGRTELTEAASDHALNPRNYGRLSRWDGRARITGPCGDTMEFWVQLRGGRVEHCTFITDGCAPSLASGSIATELAAGRTAEEALGIQQKDILEALGGLPQEVEHCALLAADTLQAACQDCLQRPQSEAGKEDPDRHTGQQAAVTPEADRQKLKSRLCRIKHKILVLSGKGGVGKSTVAVNLAMALTLEGRRVGLLDVDIHGPTVPTMLNLEGEPILSEGDALLPVELGELKVMSIGFLLRRREEAIIWRGPMKMGVIKQFLSDVEWGDLDFLIVDAPPGTGDEPLSVCQLIEDADGALLVTTPQEVALASVRKSVSFCRRLGLRVLGVVENLSGFVCPKCGEKTDIFLSGGGERMAGEMKVPFLGRIPIEPEIALGGDSGRPFVQASSASSGLRAFDGIVQAVLSLEPAAIAASPENIPIMEKHMRIAIPMADGKLSQHFGHCERFALIDVDPKDKTILGKQELEAPEHEPGLLPRWLAEKGAQLIIAGGMGARAQDLFKQNGIEVVVGAPAQAPETLVTAYLQGNLQAGDNLCDH